MGRQKINTALTFDFLMTTSILGTTSEILKTKQPLKSVVSVCFFINSARFVKEN